MKPILLVLLSLEVCMLLVEGKVRKRKVVKVVAVVGIMKIRTPLEEAEVEAAAEAEVGVVAKAEEAVKENPVLQARKIRMPTSPVTTVVNPVTLSLTVARKEVVRMSIQLAEIRMPRKVNAGLLVSTFSWALVLIKRLRAIAIALIVRKSI